MTVGNTSYMFDSMTGKGRVVYVVDTGIVTTQFCKLLQCQGSSNVEFQDFPGRAVRGAIMVNTVVNLLYPAVIPFADYVEHR